MSHNYQIKNYPKINLETAVTKLYEKNNFDST